MQTAVLIVIIAATSASTVQPPCKHFIHCPCGNTGRNVRVCADEINTENPCSQWVGCKKCQDWMGGCLECLEGLEGLSCSQASMHREQSRQKRQIQGTCPDLASPGSLNCQTKHGQRICSGMCRKEYVFENHENKRAIDLTCNNGNWTPLSKFPACKRVSTKLTCNDPGFITDGIRRSMNGTRSTSRRTFQDGELVIYSCRSEDFSLQGSSFLTCEDGSWSHPLPKCVASEEVSSYCRDPGVDPNGDRNPAYSRRNRRGFRPGTELEFFCNEGFELDGEQSIVCEPRGQWSAPIPKCAAQTHAAVSSEDILCCDEPAPISNGKVRPSFPPNLPRSCSRPTDEYEEYPEGTVLKYSCEEGYRMDGSSELYCTSSGRWTSDPPSCITDCGYSAVLASRRVTYGTKTNIGEWPWVVAISDLKDGIICGGVLLSDRVILTAAHCLPNPIRFTLYFGKLHLRDADDDYEVGVRISNRILKHPDYNNTSYDSDIALLWFAPRIRFTDRVQPICLPTRDTAAKDLMTGNIGYVTGWGVTEKDLQAKQLLLAELPFQSSSDCRESLNVSLTSNMFCSGHEEGGQSACSGDSGSPLVYLNSDISRYTLEGLVSFGIDGQCGLPKRYTVFTKVINFVPWILRNI